jgi:hypothetical protein
MRAPLLGGTVLSEPVVVVHVTHMTQCNEWYVFSLSVGFVVTG